MKTFFAIGAEWKEKVFFSIKFFFLNPNFQNGIFRFMAAALKCHWIFKRAIDIFLFWKNFQTIYIFQ